MAPCNRCKKWVMCACYKDVQHDCIFCEHKIGCDIREGSCTAYESTEVMIVRDEKREG